MFSRIALTLLGMSTIRLEHTSKIRVSISQITTLQRMVGVDLDMIMVTFMLSSHSLTQARIEGSCGLGQTNQISKKTMLRKDGQGFRYFMCMELNLYVFVLYILI